MIIPFLTVLNAKDYYDCFIKSNKENIVTYDNGKQYEEYKAELFNISITNRRFEHGTDYLTSDFMFSIFDVNYM